MERAQIDAVNHKGLYAQLDIILVASLQEGELADLLSDFQREGRLLDYIDAVSKMQQVQQLVEEINGIPLPQEEGG